VNVSNFFTHVEIPSSPKTTDEDGFVLFDVMTDVITTNTETSWLTYVVDGEYVFDNVAYITTGSVTFTSYIDDKIKNVQDLNLHLSDLRPDFQLKSSSIKFYKDGIERYTVGVGEKITIEATVYNVGTSHTTEATQVLVKFFHKDKITDEFHYLGEDIIEEPMDAQTGSAVASIIWIPEEWEAGSFEQIWVMVDPDNTVPELNDSQDNINFGSVNIILPPDLEVTLIQFNTDDLQDIDNTTETEQVTIVTTVTNVGTDQTAYSINVSVYSGFPDFDGDMKPDSPLPLGVEHIGTQYIASFLPGGQITLGFSWDTTGKSKGHSIYAYALDSAPPDSIPDQKLTNNNISVSFIVFPKPDLRSVIIPPATQNIEVLHQDGTQLSGDLMIGQIVLLRTTIFNNGHLFIPAVDVIFFEGNPDMGGEQLGNNISVSIQPRSSENVTMEWLVDGPVGERDFFVSINPEYDVIESDYSNNIWSSQFTMDYANLEIVLDPMESENITFGSTTPISGIIRFLDSQIGLPGIPVTLWVLDENNDRYGAGIITVTSPEGTFTFELTAPFQEGAYVIEVQVRQGDGVSGFATYTQQIAVFVEDGDGHIGDDDAFPNDPDEWKDSDDDGIGDNSDFLPSVNNAVFFSLLILLITVNIIIVLYFIFDKKAKKRISDGEEGRIPEMEPETYGIEEEIHENDEEIYR
jgi:hypothetical protein